MSRRIHWTTTALAVLAALFLVVGAGAGTTRGPKLALLWQAPTPADGTAFTVTAGDVFTVELSAASTQPQLVLIGKRKLPPGATFTAEYGKPGLATLTWTPAADQVGEHVLTFTASTHDLPHAYARPRSFLVYVLPSTPNGANDPFSLGGPNGLSRWARIDRTVAARARPSANAKAITRLRPLTPELTSNLVLARSGADQRERRVLGRGPPADPAERIDRLGPEERSRPVPPDLDAPRHRPHAVHGDALPARQGDLQDPRRRRQAVLADARRRVLRPRADQRLLGPHLRPDRVRDERALCRPDRLARRRLHRHPRHEPAGDPARPGLARLRPHAERRDHAALPPDAAGDAGHDHLKGEAGVRRGPARMSFRASVRGHGNDDLLGTHIEACFRRGYRCGVLWPCSRRGRPFRPRPTPSSRGPLRRRPRELLSAWPRRRSFRSASPPTRPRRLWPFGSGRAPDCRRAPLWRTRTETRQRRSSPGLQVRRSAVSTG